MVAKRPGTAALSALQLSDPHWAEFLKRQSALLEVADPQTRARSEPPLRVMSGQDFRWQHMLRLEIGSLLAPGHST